MDFTAMLSKGKIRNGTAVAALIAAVPLAAQRPASTRPRDSVFVRMFVPGVVALDSLKALFQEFDREQYGTARWIALSGRIDSLFRIPAASNATVFFRGVLAGAEANRQSLERLGWIGLNTQGPNRQMNLNGELFVTQFAYPLIVTVDPQSPADKAGITAGDLLVAYNGIDVVNHEFNLSTLLKPDSKIAVTVRREGETKEYQLVAAKAPPRIMERRLQAEMSANAVTVRQLETPEGIARAATRRLDVPGEGVAAGGSRIIRGAPMLMITSNGVFGASASTVNSELARVLNLKAGVLVNDVPEDSPAFRAGLRTGDVITAVGDQPVISLSELRRVLVLAHEASIPLQVTSRNQKTRIVTVSLTPPSAPPPPSP